MFLNVLFKRDGIFLATDDRPHPGPESRPGGCLNHDHALHPAMTFDGTPKVIHARRQGQHKFEPLTGSQGNPLLKGAGLLAGIRHDLDSMLGNQGTLKLVGFPALIPHHEVHGLPCPQVDPSRREPKIVDDDGHVLVLGGTGAKAQHEDQKEFDRSPAPC